MADRTQENLARIRACDADWNENDHPRADNGQFTSGSGGGGAKVSKLQSGGKAKVQQLKNVSGALAGVNAGIEKADNTFAARMDRTRKAGAAKHKDLEQREDAVRKKYEGDWRYGSMYGKLKNKPGMERLAERVKNKAKSREAQKRDELAGLEKEYHQIQNEYDPIVGERQRAANKQYEKTMRQLYPQKQALEAEQKKFQGAKKTLEKAKPGIAKMREQAQAADPGVNISKATQAMKNNGRFFNPSEEAAVFKSLSKNKKYADFAKAGEKLNQKKEAAAKQALAKARPKIAAMRSANAPAEKPAAAPAAKSPAESADRFTKIAAEYKKYDTDIAKYARQMAKVAGKNGEEAALKWAEDKMAEIEKSDMYEFAKGYHRGRLNRLLEEYAGNGPVMKALSKEAGK